MVEVEEGGLRVCWKVEWVNPTDPLEQIVGVRSFTDLEPAIEFRKHKCRVGWKARVVRREIRDWEEVWSPPVLPAAPERA